MGHMDARERIESGWPALDRLVSEVLGTRREVAAAQAREARLLADAVDLVTERVAERRLQGERVSDADLPLREVSLELGMAMRVSDRTIQGRMGDASTLVTRFVTTFEAWQRGRVDAGHVWAIVRAGIGITDEGGREAYERLALEAAATESAGRMGRVAREIAAAVSPEDFAAEVRNAFAERMVRVYDLDGGMARILADLPAPLAYAIADRLTEFAEHALAAEPEDDEDACSDGEGAGSDAESIGADGERIGGDGATAHSDRGKAGAADSHGVRLPYTADDALAESPAGRESDQGLREARVVTGPTRPTGEGDAARSSSPGVAARTDLAGEHAAATDEDEHQVVPDDGATAGSAESAAGDAGRQGTGGRGTGGQGAAGGHGAAGGDAVRGDAVGGGSASRGGRDTRTLDQARADVLADLLLAGAPSVLGDAAAAISGRVHVTVPAATLAGIGDQPALLAGYGPIDPELARRLAAAAPSWIRVFTDPQSGLPVAVDGYRPSAELRRFLHARDERCRTPGCVRPAQRCDLDHNHDTALGGATTLENLCHFCRRHHVAKHRTAWRVRQLPGGVIEWTGPTGRRYRDRPPATVRFVPAPIDRESRPPGGRPEAPPF